VGNTTTSFDVNQFCSPHHTGPLCELCEPGFVMQDGVCGVCVNGYVLKITRTGVVVVSVLSALLFAAVAWTLLKRVFPRAGWQSLRGHASRLCPCACRRANGAAGGVVGGAGGVVSGVGAGAGDNAQRSTSSWRTRLKNMSGYLQVFSVIVGEYGFAFPAAVSTVASWFAVLNLDPFSFVRIGCAAGELDQLQRLVVITVVPAAAIVVLLATSRLLRIMPLSAASQSTVQDSLFTAMLAVMFLAHPTVRAASSLCAAWVWSRACHIVAPAPAAVPQRAVSWRETQRPCVVPCAGVDASGQVRAVHALRRRQQLPYRGLLNQLHVASLPCVAAVQRRDGVGVPYRHTRALLVAHAPQPCQHLCAQRRSLRRRHLGAFCCHCPVVDDDVITVRVVCVASTCALACHRVRVRRLRGPAVHQ
jgi:hypothetical protein